MNIVDYIKKFGDTPLTCFNIRQADVMVLTVLSYIDFSMVADEFHTFTKISDAINQLFAFGIQEKGKNMAFLKSLKESRRFSDLYICGYRNEFDSLSHATQFSVITIKISESLWFISYSGTDGTVVGWKEDFQFSYLPQTPAQEKARQYLAAAAEQLPGNFIISGHSKGGNLAAYAAIFADQAVQNRINTIFCNDSPGFNQQINLLEQPGYQRIASKFCCVVPQDSIIGQLLQTLPWENYSVIHSNSPSLIFQHDMFSWEIDETGNPCWLARMNSSTRKSMKKLNRMILNLSISERKELTNLIFDWLEEKNIHHLEAIKYYLPWQYLLHFR